MYGCNGILLRVNLTTQRVSREALSEATVRQYLGGRGLAAYLLCRELPPGTDPLGPQNKLILATGLLTGTPVPTGNRLLVAAKSPLTGIWGDSTIGGFIGSKLKAAGVDAVVIEGCAPTPVYLWIHDGQADIRPADSLWGLETGPARAAIQEGTEKGASVAVVGPGAENGVHYASIMADQRFAAGRAGMGAVLASKRVKGVAMSGKGQPLIAEPKGLQELSSALLAEFREAAPTAALSGYGTWLALGNLMNIGLLPVHNFRGGDFPEMQRLNGQAMTEAILKDRETCRKCSIVCRPVAETAGPPPVMSEYGGPEFETVAALGSLLDNFEPAIIAKANELCNRYGIDTISTGVCIAWAMECTERGIDLSTALRTGLGQPIAFGDGPAVLRLIEDIAMRRGLGDLLADGVRAAARRVGQGSEAWAPEVKGLELPMHDPRGKKGQGISFATAPRGADHMQAVHDEGFQLGGPYPDLGLGNAMDRLSVEGKARLVKITQDFVGTLADSLGLCKLPMLSWRALTPTRVTELVHLVTGWDVTLDELLTTGERIFNLCRLFNVREGISRADDRLPARLAEPLPTGKSQGQTFDRPTLENALTEYYALRGWDRQGIPEPATIARLGLNSIPFK
jgi:aldehyde:ferredoxin oxidoreductase